MFPSLVLRQKTRLVAILVTSDSEASVSTLSHDLGQDGTTQQGDNAQSAHEGCQTSSGGEVAATSSHFQGATAQSTPDGNARRVQRPGGCNAQEGANAQEGVNAHEGAGFDASRGARPT